MTRLCFGGDNLIETWRRDSAIMGGNEAEYLFPAKGIENRSWGPQQASPSATVSREGRGRRWMAIQEGPGHQ